MRRRWQGTTAGAIIAITGEISMPARTFAVAAIVTVLIGMPVRAAPSAHWDSCTGTPDVPWEQQIKACTAIIDAKTETPERLATTYNNRAVARLGMVGGGMVLPDKQAMTDLEAAIKLNPKYADAYYNRGRVWFAAGVYGNAADLFTAAIELDPKHAGAYHQRGTTGSCWATPTAPSPTLTRRSSSASNPPICIMGAPLRGTSGKTSSERSQTTARRSASIAIFSLPIAIVPRRGSNGTNSNVRSQT
jgi:hypothetical protein